VVPVPSITKLPPGSTVTPPVAPTGNLAQTGIDLGRTFLIGILVAALGAFLVLLRRRSANRLLRTAQG
jgi:LPXTG-motif cell wall-anchored protein